jgi:hypothetical protein
VDGGMSEVVYLFEISGEHIRMLVIFGRDVALYCFGDRDIVRPTEGEV